MTLTAEFVNGQGGKQEVGYVTSANPASIAAGAKGTVALTVAGLATTDQILSVNARGLATGLVVMGATITAANTITVQLHNTTEAAIDDDASIYDYSVLLKS